MKKISCIFFVMLFFIQLTSGAHYIVGIVNNARDGRSANGLEVVLWNPSNGIQDNQTDIIGTSGNSGADNIYMIDCEMLNSSCSIGNTIRVQVLDSLSPNLYKDVVVTGGAYNIVNNMTLNSFPNISFLEVEDYLEIPSNEIDLMAASSQRVYCIGVLEDLDNESEIANASAEFFFYNSGWGEADDNNTHYTNSSCLINRSFGSWKGYNDDGYRALANCSFDVMYYANSGLWNCTMRVNESAGFSYNKTDNTLINSLLSIGAQDNFDFGMTGATFVSSESSLDITNYGNVVINLSVRGYGYQEGDGLAMNCSPWNYTNISVYHQKYNFSSSNPGILSWGQADLLYQNLSSDSEVRTFNLNFRQNELLNEAVNTTYWRIYTPEEVSGYCSGNIVFSAVQAGET